MEEKNQTKPKWYNEHCKQLAIKYLKEDNDYFIDQFVKDIFKEAQKELLNIIDVKMEINKKNTGKFILDEIDLKLLKEQNNNGDWEK